jgi:hypothetical protein
MFVYIWKDPSGVPFYVGMGSTLGRTNPKAKCHRNKACVQKLVELGADAVIVEIRTTSDEDSAKALEQQLISQYGRIRDGGTLTNISGGGEFHRVSQETRQKLADLWKDEEHRVKAISSRIGKKRNLPESTKQVLRESLANNEAMKSWGERNGKDPEFDAKRIEGIKAAQPARAAKMADPAALAQRKERLKATMNSPEFKAKRALFNTPEYRKKLSDAKREYWAKKKLAQSV